MTDDDAPSDALVLFGATGDLAKKKIFPAIYNMTEVRPRPRAGGRLRVVGVGRRRAAPARPRGHRGEGPDRRSGVGRTSSSGSRYVRGDYRDASSFAALADRLRDARGGAPALLPRRPSRALRRCDPRAREPASPGGGSGRGGEALRARPGVGPRAQRDPPPGVPRDVGVPHRPLPRQGVGGEPARVPLRQLAARAGVEPQLHLERADHDGRVVRRRGARALLRVRRRAARRRAEPPAPGGRAPRDGTAGGCRCQRAARRAHASCSARSAPSSRRSVVRGQYRGYREEDGVAPESDVETYVALRLEIDSWRWAGVPFLIRTGKRLPVTATEAVVEFNAPAAPPVPAAGCTGAAPEPPPVPAGPRGRRDAAPPDQEPGRRAPQPRGRPRGELRRGVRRAAGGLPAPARGRHGRRHPALRARRCPGGAVADLRARPRRTRTR